jgi:hypothetical protein
MPPERKPDRGAKINVWEVQEPRDSGALRKAVQAARAGPRVLPKARPPGFARLSRANVPGSARRSGLHSRTGAWIRAERWTAHMDTSLDPGGRAVCVNGPFDGSGRRSRLQRWTRHRIRPDPELAPSDDPTDPAGRTDRTTEPLDVSACPDRISYNALDSEPSGDPDSTCPSGTSVRIV